MNTLKKLALFLLLFLPMFAFCQNPEKASKYYSKGNKYFQKANYTKAIDYYARSYQADSGFAKAYVGMAKIQLINKKYDLALPLLLKSKQIGQPDLETNKLFAKTYYELGQYNSSYPFCLKVFEQEPQNAEVVTQMAHILEQQQKYDEAIAHWTKLIALQPNNPQWYAGRARCKCYTGDAVAAIADAQQGLAHVAELKDKADYYALRATAYTILRNFTPALNDFNKAIAIDSNNALLYYKRGLAKKESNLVDAAQADFTQAQSYDANMAYKQANDPLLSTMAQWDADKTAPQIEMEYPKLQVGHKIIVQQDGFTAKGKVSDPVGVALVTVNGHVANLNKDGSFYLPISLQRGEHFFTVKALDTRNNEAKTSFGLEYNPQKEQGSVEKMRPQISFSSPVVGADGKVQLQFVRVVIRGKVLDWLGVEQLMLNGKKLALGTKGEFKHELPLAVGENTVELVAVNSLGHKTTKRMQIFRTLSPAERLAFESKPELFIEYPVVPPTGTVEVSNPSINMYGKVNCSCEIKSVDINGEPVTVSKDGSFAQPLQLAMGDNPVAIKALSTFGAEATQRVVIKRVRPGEQLASVQQPAVLEILSPNLTRGFKVKALQDYFVIKGQVRGGSHVQQVVVNDKAVPVDAQGFFTMDTSLNPGENHFRVRVANPGGKETEKRFTVVKGNADVVSTNQPAKSVTDTEIKSSGKYYALIVGIENYQDKAIASLDRPIDDAQLLYDVLTKKYTFETENVTFLKNPKKEDITKAFDFYTNRVTGNDNLLIFYAGHGYWDKSFQQGYWLASDAKKKSRTSWLSNSIVRDYMRGIKTKHTLLVTDACFGGGIFKTRAAFSDASVAIQEMHKYPSRKAMTSGALTEVPDKSVFIEYLVKRLQQNDKKYLSSEQLFASFKTAVINNSSSKQVPQFGEVRETGDEGGDFILIQR